MSSCNSAATCGIFDDSSSTSTNTKFSSMSRRDGVTTDTRVNITPKKLVAIDDPIQPRKYITPSVTSRKDVPAFARKRSRSQAFGDEEDQLDKETIQLPTNPVPQELIEAKRRQNTIAARRSRQRKLEYQRELENQVEILKRERDEWELKARTYYGMLRSHGINAPQYC